MYSKTSIFLFILVVCAACAAPPPKPVQPVEFPTLPHAVEVALSTQVPTAGSTPVNQADRDAQVFRSRLDREIPGLLEKYHVPGVSIALVRHGEIAWVAGYGMADIESGKPITPHTIFRVASISKPVTAWGVMHLVEQGKIDLQAPVERYLTRWHLPPSLYDVNQVTIYRLLSHTAGLNIHGYGRGWIDGPPPTLEESLSGTAYASEGVRIIQKPGSGFLYSGGGYTVLQLVVEEVTGQRFADYMQKEVLDPLGMTESGYNPSPDILSRMATAYDQNYQVVPQRIFAEQAAAGLYATAADLARFLTAGLVGPDGSLPGWSILEPKTLDLMYTPALEAEGKYGLGYETYSIDGVRLAFHGGDNPGWESTFTLIPDLGEGIVCLTNSDAGENLNPELTHTWVQWLDELY